MARRSRGLRGSAATTVLVPPLDAPRRLRETVIDFRTLHLPAEVATVLLEAFWHRLGAGRQQTILDHWSRIRFFGRFNKETRAVRSLADLQGSLLSRYVEWLNSQRTERGTPLSKATRSSTYTSLHKLLQWLLHCRPGLLGPIEWPINPFPWRNRDTCGRSTISASELREILKACEREITEIRRMRERGRELIRTARATHATYMRAPGAVLDFIGREFGGVLPPTPLLYRTHRHFLRYLVAHGGVEVIEPYLYPNGYGLFPYYLLIVLHTAGNSQAIAEMSMDCLQPIPLIEDRELLIWEKPRAGSVQRRSFKSSDPFEPPALVRDIIDWTRPLRAHVAREQRGRLFLIKTTIGGPTAATRIKFMRPLRRFIATHKLKPFSMGSLRPSVLSALYRSSGDLRAVKAMANHVSIATTASYVRGREVSAQNTLRMAALQSALLGHIEPSQRDRPSTRPRAWNFESPPPGTAVSMFGFSCKDPLAGIAPGTRRGELCTNFLACLVCPNAIIPADVPTLARLLHARDHLKSAATHVHPARWAAIYAPQVRIIEEDLLSRFPLSDHAEAERLRSRLPPLLPLR